MCANFANRMKKAMHLKGMKQADIVEATKIGKSSVSQYLSGNYQPKQKNIYLISKALNVNEAWLMGYDVPIEKVHQIKESLLLNDIENINTMSAIMNRIKNRRIELELSYQDLADKTGLSKSTLQRYETGSIKNMPLDKLEIIANVLQTTPHYIMGWEDIQNSSNDSRLSSEQNQLFDDFNKLNTLGKREAAKRISELTQISNYTCKIEDNVTTSITSIKESPKTLEDIYTTIAAHYTYLTECEKEEMDRKILEALKMRQK